jgi:Domain of Unknown Function with PDB structure (DUF3857)
MKRIFYLLLLLFYGCPAAIAQKKLPLFGKIDKADLLMTDCDFDKGAIAVKLIDWGNTYYTRGTAGEAVFKTVFERRVRIKILKQKGLSQANIKIPFFSNNNEEKIISISGYTYNADDAGNIQSTGVKKNAIYTKRINTSYSQAIIAFPDVKVGSVIEYKYQMERETMGQLRDWFFQERIPVRYSEYQLTIPQIFRFSVQPSVIDPMEQKQKVIDEVIAGNNGLIKTKSLQSNYIMHNLPGIKDEPFMGSAKDYMQRLEFQLSQIDYGHNNIGDLSLKWSNVVEDLMNNNDFGLQLEKPVWAAEAFIEEAKKIAVDENKMKFILGYLRKTINWNGVNDIYADNGITKTWETKTGNSADINLLLVKLLNDAGIKTFPVLFSTRDNGMVNNYYPFINQFNTVMAFVNINQKSFVLDASDKISNYKLLPQKIANTKGFIVQNDNSSWKDFFTEKNKYKVVAAVHGAIDTAGVMSGNCLVNCFDYARVQRHQSWMTDKDVFKEIYFTQPNIQTEDLRVNNIDADSLPLEQKIKFNSALNGSGDYRYFTVNLFSGLDENPFIAEERIADIDFGVEQDYTFFGNYTLPQNYVFDELPENVYMILPDTSIVFTRSVQAEENLLNVRMTLEFKRSFYFAADYADFKEFYKKLFAKLNEQVIIKKKV